MAKTQPAKSEIIAEMLGGQVTAWECVPALHFINDLFPEERKLIDKAVEKRQAEFATARVLARRAMRELGVPPQPLLHNDDHSPRWPEGMVGTLTHTEGYCAVALALSSGVCGLGLDAESSAPLTAALIDRICCETELAWLGEHPPALRGQLARLVFSAKEAFYKCQYPITRSFLDFKDVELDFDEARRAFRVAVVRKLSASSARVCEAQGAYRVTADHILSAMVLHN